MNEPADDEPPYTERDQHMWRAGYIAALDDTDRDGDPVGAAVVAQLNRGIV